MLEHHFFFFDLGKELSRIIILKYTFKNLTMKWISLLKIYNKNSHVMNFIDLVNFLVFNFKCKDIKLFQVSPLYISCVIFL
jgi:hypothetical protein